ncbi:MAG: hypothetical protein EZS26_000787 [Candidatus Ordinivivax streblomastigis]|uniref:XRE family transcriptional regulator n=1 Tax=Candidatus Ordinivivax streblomastigis TaxID=2540710 RepID=A0A5M8P479_9BACT|nr:MAG: hypothetical protein EZS26_000787 [Candidatus Ordinivivax streblomastigis]
MNTKTRLLEFLTYLGIGQNAFEKINGISNGYISHLKSSIGSDIINKISSNYPELNIDWLLNGKGIMIRENNQKIKDNTIGVGNFNTGDNPIFHTYPITEETIKNASQGYQDIIKTYQEHMAKLLNIIDKLTDKYGK